MLTQNKLDTVVYSFVKVIETELLNSSIYLENKESKHYRKIIEWLTIQNYTRDHFLLLNPDVVHKLCDRIISDDDIRNFIFSLNASFNSRVLSSEISRVDIDRHFAECYINSTIVGDKTIMPDTIKMQFTRITVEQATTLFNHNQWLLIVYLIKLYFSETEFFRQSILQNTSKD
jgi:hypothetical protein